MKNPSFEMRWGFFAIGALLGFPSMLILLFIAEDRRNKFYSQLTGALISVLLNLGLFHYLKPV
jgi:hypothetical protein